MNWHTLYFGFPWNEVLANTGACFSHFCTYEDPVGFEVYVVHEMMDFECQSSLYTTFINP